MKGERNGWIWGFNDRARYTTLYSLVAENLVAHVTVRLLGYMTLLWAVVILIGPNARVPVAVMKSTSDHDMLQPYQYFPHIQRISYRRTNLISLSNGFYTVHQWIKNQEERGPPRSLCDRSFRSLYIRSQQ